MKNQITAYLGIESLSVKQIIDSIFESGKFPNVSREEMNKMLLDRRPVELLLMMKECLKG